MTGASLRRIDSTEQYGTRTCGTHPNPSSSLRACRPIVSGLITGLDWGSRLCNHPGGWTV